MLLFDVSERPAHCVMSTCSRCVPFVSKNRLRNAVAARRLVSRLAHCCASRGSYSAHLLRATRTTSSTAALFIQLSAITQLSSVAVLLRSARPSLLHMACLPCAPLTCFVAAGCVDLSRHATARLVCASRLPSIRTLSREPRRARGRSTRASARIGRMGRACELRC